MAPTPLQPEDVVSLKSDPTLIGVVENVWDSGDPTTDHQDALILLHSPVSTDAANEFLVTGMLPDGHVFVSWCIPLGKGSSLVEEGDLILLDRHYVIGDNVQLESQRDTKIGVVADVEEFYTLEPIVAPVLGLENFMFHFIEENDAPTSVCGPGCTEIPSALRHHRRPHDLLYRIPGSELKRGPDFREGDHIAYKGWLGTVTAVDEDVVLLLEDKSVVMVHKPWELERLISKDIPEVLSRPEPNNSKLSEIDLSKYNASMMVPADELCRSHLVVTNHSNLEKGRWLHGRYNPSIDPVGRVVDVRSRRLDIQWLAPNVFDTLIFDENHDPWVPPDCVTPWENLGTYKSPREIRRDKDVILLDGHRPLASPATADSANQRDGSKSSSGAHKTNPAIGIVRYLQPGDHARWLDSADAKAKYNETPENTHGCLRPVPRETTLDFDLNEFRVVHTEHLITVLWQDGSTTQELSTGLRFAQPLDEPFFPGDIVTAREGSKMILKEKGEDMAAAEITVKPEQAHVELDFDEMQAFEHNFTLKPSRVGVVQSIDSTQRVAQVRWFVKPQVVIMGSGQLLGSSTTFGEIGPEITDVSLFEIMGHGVLDVRRRDIVMVVPRSITARLSKSHKYSRARLMRKGSAVPLRISQLGADDLVYLAHDLTELVLGRDSVRNAVEDAMKRPKGIIKQHPLPVEWAGEVVNVHCDGSITIRKCAGGQNVDMNISRDEIGVIVDTVTTTEPWGMTIEYSDEESWSEDYKGSPSPIDEEVMYDGGQRLDNDSDDEEWMTDEEPPGTPSDLPDLEMIDVDSSPGPSQTAADQTRDVSQQEQTMEPPEQLTPTTNDSERDLTTARLLTDKMPLCQPPAFEILTDVPPNDHFGTAKPPKTTPILLRRLNTEHRVLGKSLPASVYVRTYESRLDLLRCLIIGPEDTPYEHAPFLFDLYLENFPHEPPKVHFHSWTHGLGRVNPNLYEKGHVCLSLLGTWSGSEGESWSQNATLLQLLVSLQGLVFVKDPYYNEAGFETLRQQKAKYSEAMQYSEKAYVICRNFIRYALRSPVAGLEDVLGWQYAPMQSGDSQAAGRNHLVSAIARGIRLAAASETAGPGSHHPILDGEGQDTSPEQVFLRPLSLGALVMLKRTLEDLGQLADDLTVAMRKETESAETSAEEVMDLF